MYTRLFILFGLLSLAGISHSFAQEQESVSSSSPIDQKQSIKKSTTLEGTSKDSLRLVYERMPLKSTLYSAVIPGLGQINNKRWWKVPIIYAGLVLFVVQYNENNNAYRSYLAEAQYRVNHSGQVGNPAYAGFPASYIIATKETYRRNRDLCVLGLVAVYAANIIDAYVDAKFFRFDISDKLSLKVSPSFGLSPSMETYASIHPTIKISLEL